MTKRISPHVHGCYSCSAEDKTMTDQLEEARILAALAGLNLPSDREASLAGGLALTKRIAESLAAADLAATEPAAQFRAPAAPSQ
jgi:hypothetical protein